YHARCRRLRSAFRCVHVPPPSSDRYTPPESASISAHTRLDLAPDTAKPIFPHGWGGSPAFPVSSLHVSPPSVDLKMPPPGPPEFRDHGVRYACQNAAYSTFASFGSTARSEMPVRASRYRTFRHVKPPSVVLKTPRCSLGPKACPINATQTMSGLVGWIRMRLT